MASFPALFSGVVALYPVQAHVVQRVGIHQFTDFTEQRWSEMAALRRFVIALSGIKKGDRDSLESFFNTVKGGFDHTWDITFDGVLYENMTFEGDVFMCRESNAPEHWDLSLACHQIRKT
jgi:hypothetical protein